MESLDQCRHLEVHEKARNVFVMSLHLSDHKVVTQHRIFIKFFSISLRFSRFFRLYFILQIFGFKEFNKTIIPFTLVGYKMVIANEARSAELAIYHLISNAHSWNIFAQSPSIVNYCCYCGYEINYLFLIFYIITKFSNIAP